MTQVPWVGLTPRSPAIAGQRHVGDRRVEHVHERRQRQRDRAPDAGRALQRRRARPAARRRGRAISARRRDGVAAVRCTAPASASAGCAARRAPRVGARRRRAAEVGGDDAAHLGVGAARRAASKTAVCATAARRGASASVLPSWSASRRPWRPSTGRRAADARPARSASSAMRTGTRCTTLIQLPVAFCAGSSAKAAPVPAPRPSTGRGTRPSCRRGRPSAHRLADAHVAQLALP